MTRRLRLQDFFTLATATPYHLSTSIMRDDEMPHQATVDETQTREPIATGDKSIKTVPDTTNDNADSTDHTKPNPQSTSINVNVNDQSSPRSTTTKSPCRASPLNLPPPDNFRPLRLAALDRSNAQRSLQPLPNPLPLLRTPRTRSRPLRRSPRDIVWLFALDCEVCGQVWGCVDFHFPRLEFVEIFGMEVCDGGDK